MRLALPWVVVAAVGEAGYRGVVVAAVDEAGCRGSGWRTVWVRLAAVGQADVLGMRMPAGSLEKRSGLMQNSSSESQLLCYSTATKPDLRKGICCGRRRNENFTAAGLPRARDLLCGTPLVSYAVYAHFRNLVLII